MAYMRGMRAQHSRSETRAPAALASTDARGRLLFVQACTGCHLLDGEGRQSAWAALHGDHGARDPSGKNESQVLIQGSQIETSQGAMFMHSFIGGYSDHELAPNCNLVISQL